MKKLLAALFLFSTICALGQSASSILATLHTKGTTKTGGDSKYENYIPLLVTNGVLDYSVIPTNMIMHDVAVWVNDNGSRFDKNLISSLEDRTFDALDTFMYELRTGMSESFSNFEARVILMIPFYEEDPLFDAFTKTNTVAIGVYSHSTTNAIQLLDGTNNVPGTFKFMDTVVVDQHGRVPHESIPYAATTNQINQLNSDKLSVGGGKMTGPLNIKLNTLTYEFVESETNVVSFDGMMLVDTENLASFAGVMCLNDAFSTPGEKVRKIFHVDSALDSSADGWVKTLVVEVEPGVSITNTFTRSDDYETVFVESILEGGRTNTCFGVKTANNIEVGNVGETVYKHVHVKNPSGLVLKDIQEPVPYFDLTSPTGAVFRIRISDDGILNTTRVK